MESYKKTASRLSFLDYTALYAARLRQLGRYGGARNLHNATNRLKAFLVSVGKKDVSFAKLQPALVERFEAWLLQGKVCRNTSSSYMRSLHTAFNQAVKDGTARVESSYGRSNLCPNPFVNVYCGVDKTAKRAVDKSYIRSLLKLDIPSKLTRLYRNDGKRTQGKYFDNALRQLELARDLFIFSFCMRGMAFVDMAFLRKTAICDGHIHYARRKTHQRIVVRIEPMMQDILDRWQTDGAYIFPVLTEENDISRAYCQYQNQLSRYNRNLKTLGRMLGDITLTSYVSRHSWASTAHAENVPLSVISQSMGHDSERTTRIYLQELDNTVLDRCNSDLLSTVFSGKKTKNYVK